MRSRVGEGTVHLALYAVATAITALATFASIPLLVRHLDLTGFGIWSLTEPLLMLGASVALLGIEHGAIKQVALDHQSVRLVLGRLVPAAAPVLFLAAGISYLVSVPYLGHTGGLLVAFLIPFEGVLTLVTTTLRANRQIGLYAIAQAGRAILFAAFIGLSLSIPAWAHGSVTDVLFVRLAIAAAICCFLFVKIKPHLTWNSVNYSDAVRYGAFLLVTGILAQVLDNTDRYVLGLFNTTEHVGAYVVHVKLATMLGQGIVTPFMLWFPAERFRHLNDPDGGKEFFRTAALGLLFLLLLAGGTIFLMGYFLIGLIAPDVTYSPFVLLNLIVASAAIGMSYALNVGLLQPGRTHLNAYAALGAALLALLFTFLLVPMMGNDGAAIARAAACVCYMLIIARLSQSIYRIPFHLWQMAFSTLATVFCLAALSYFCSLRSVETTGISVLIFWLFLGATFLPSRKLISPQKHSLALALGDE
jgi:O-antigen/teichoic acid export membrane protein